jgi:hypothetical protein
VLDSPSLTHNLGVKRSVESNVRRLILLIVAVAIVCIAAALIVFPMRESIRGGWGLLFWIGLALL